MNFITVQLRLVHIKMIDSKMCLASFLLIEVSSPKIPNFLLS